MNKKGNIYLKKTNPQSLFIFLGAIFIFLIILSVNIISVTSRGVVGDIEKGLIGHWPLNGTYDTKDITPYGMNGVSYGAALSTGIKGEGNGSYNFNGTSSYININNSNKLNFGTGDFTLVAWVKPNNILTDSTIYEIVNKGGEGTIGWGISVRYGKIMSAIQATGGSNQNNYSNSLLNNNQWNHVVIVHKRNDKIYYYLNGVSDGSAVYGAGNNTGSVDNSSNAVIGSFVYKSSGFFLGSILDVRAYNRALSATEVKSLFEMYKPSLGSSSLNKGLVASYSLNSELGVKDSTPNSNNGVLSGATLTIGRKGEANGAYYFDGTDSISLPNDLGYRNQVSVFSWFKSNGTPIGGYHIIVGGQELEISIPTNGELRTGIYTNARFVSNSGSGLTDGNWHFVGFSFDGSTKNSYIDGVLVGQQSVTGNLTYSFSNRKIGQFGSNTTYYLNGSVTDLKVYNRALSSQEVKSLYDSLDSKLSTGTLNKGLILNMPLTNSYMKGSSIVSDNTPYGNDGDISGVTINETEAVFNGAGSSLNISPHNINLSNKFTIACWLKFDQYAYMQLLNIGGFQFKWRVSGQYPYWNLYNSSGTYLGSITYNTIPSLNTWNYYVFSYDGTTRKIYLNGVLNTSSSATGNILVNPDFNIVANSSEVFDGSMSGIKLWNRALTDDEVKLLYDRGRN